MLVGLALLALPARALEADPYLAWLVEIPDSSVALNSYTNAVISGHLQVLAERGRAGAECPAVVVSLFKDLHHSALTRRRAVRFLTSSPDVVSWKGGGVWSSVWRSYYRRLPVLYVSSIARTIDVNGIRFSVDKVGHFFGAGRKYYKRYLRAIGEGEDPAQAERTAVRYGIRQENLFVGKWIDTIFSHADLEANYQGLRFARDLCEGEEPYLRKVAGVWVLDRDVDLRDYVTPAFDEGYNTNHFTALGWLLVRSRLESYCPLLKEPVVERRLDYYRGFPGPSASQRTVAEVLAQRGSNPQDRHSLAALCAANSR